MHSHFTFAVATIRSYFVLTWAQAPFTDEWTASTRPLVVQASDCYTLRIPPPKWRRNKPGQVVQNSRLPFAVNVTRNLSNDCHCLGDMAVCMGNVLTRWWFVVLRLASISHRVGVVIRSGVLNDLRVKTTFGFRLRLRRYDKVKTGLSESQAEAEELNLTNCVSVGTCIVIGLSFPFRFSPRS